MEEKDVKKSQNKSGVVITVIIIAIIFLCVGVIEAIINNQNKETSNSYISSKEEKENPYEVSTKYDGTYYFKLESTSNSGSAYYLSVGMITLNNGKCEAKYIVQSEGFSYELKHEYDGFCGLNNTDSKFYFSLNDDKYIYMCEKAENGLNCELKSTYDLSGWTENTSLTLKLLDKTKDKEAFYTKFVNEEKTKWENEIEQKKAEEKAKKEAEEKAKKEAEEHNFKASCQTYTFEQMARNPDNFKGTNVKLTGEVVQALYGTNSVDLRVNITKKGNYSTYYTDTIYVTYNTKTGEDKILEDDIITIYGTSMGDYSYTSTMNARITLPWISAKYITLE